MRFRSKTILGVGFIEMVLLAVLVGSALSILRNSNEAELTRRVELGGKLLAAAAKDAVISQDLATLDSLVSAAMASGQISFVRILDAQGVVLAERGDESLLAHSVHPKVRLDQATDDAVFDCSVPVFAGGINQGEVQLGVSTDPLKGLLASALRWAASIAGLEMLLVALFSWLLGSYLTRQLSALRKASEHFAAGDLAYRVRVYGNDELAQTALAFNLMAQQLGASHALLREAVSSIAQGFTIYDENDRLMLCNEAYLHFYETSRDLIVPGKTFTEIVRVGAERGQYRAALSDVDAWVQQRVAQHQKANGEMIEQQLADGRWLLVVEYRTPSGYIVGNRIDITELKTATEALRQRELYLRATLDNLPFSFWLKDAENRFLTVNKVYSDACGRASPEEVVGLTDFDVWPQAVAERYRADDWEVMASRHEKWVEESVGSDAHWMETYKKPVIEADGSLLGTVGFARDISDRKQLDAALAASEQRWQLAVSGANDGIWDWDVQGNQVYFSERWKTMLGYSGTEIGTKVGEWIERVHPDDLERTQAEVQRHLFGETEFYQCEHRLRCKNGDYKWVLDRGRALIDANGKALRMAGSHTDITERREAEARIRDRTEQLNAIFDLSPDGFVSFDAAHGVKYANPAFLRMTGLDEDEMEGLDESAFSVLLAQLCIEQARFPGVEALQKNTTVRRQLIELAGTGKRILEVRLRLAKAETVSKILYFRDVTHETEVDRIKSEFLSTAAHELRTPMASIYGFTELLLSQKVDEEVQRDFLETIYRQSELMILIVNELLDLARIEARRGKDFKIKRIELRSLLAEILAGFKPPGGRAVPADVPGSTPLWVRADYNKLTQAIGNVLSNAYKYSPAGGPIELTLIKTGAEDDSDAPARIGIRIIDHGIGMTPQQLARVSERFYRADSSGKIPGTGLGMSIVKEIIELHRGELQLASQLGAGTTVTLWIPLATEVVGSA